MKNGKQINKNMSWQTGRFSLGQASLELSVALIVVAMLLIAMVRIFIWVNGGLIRRQVGYQAGRVAAGSETSVSVTPDLINRDGLNTAGLEIGETMPDDPGSEELNLII